jgi:hypothetical protein
MYPEYRDLESEAQTKGLFAVLDEFKPLFESRCCPGCKNLHSLNFRQLDGIGYKFSGLQWEP